MKIKNILVIDLEATCWENSPPSDSKGARNEIIEIGIAVVDISQSKIVESRSILVIPPTCEISPFCTKLTTLTAQNIASGGIPYIDAMNILKKEYKADKQIFASWGDYDRKAIDKNCRWNGVSNPMSNQHLNVKALYGAIYGETVGLDAACKTLKMDFEGTHHRGVDDARMIAAILLTHTS